MTNEDEAKLKYSFGTFFVNFPKLGIVFIVRSLKNLCLHKEA